MESFEWMQRKVWQVENKSTVGNNGHVMWKKSSWRNVKALSCLYSSSFNTAWEMITNCNLRMKLYLICSYFPKMLLRLITLMVSYPPFCAFLSPFLLCGKQTEMCYYQEQLQQQHQQKQQAFEALVGVFPILWRAWRTLAAASWWTCICLLRISTRSEPMDCKERTTKWELH